MKFRLVMVALVSAVLASAGAMHSAAQDGEKKAPAKTAPKKASEKKEPQKKEAQKKEAPKAEQKEQKKAEPKKTPGTPALIAQFGDWGVYVNKTAKICFALTQPKSREPANIKRDPAYFYITTRPGEKLTNVVSIAAGFPLNENTEVVLHAAGANYPLFVKGHGLWIKNADDEAKLVDALRKEDEIVLKLAPVKGTVTTDVYSLTGVAQALERVAKECP